MLPNPYADPKTTMSDLMTATKLPADTRQLWLEWRQALALANEAETPISRKVAWMKANDIRRDLHDNFGRLLNRAWMVAGHASDKQVSKHAYQVATRLHKLTEATSVYHI